MRSRMEDPVSKGKDKYGWEVQLSEECLSSIRKTRGAMPSSIAEKAAREKQLQSSQVPKDHILYQSIYRKQINCVST